MKPTTRAQREACYTLYCRNAARIQDASTAAWHIKTGWEKYLAFRRCFHNNGQWLGGCIPLAFSHRGCGKVGTYYGIEPCGHTHT